MHEQITQLDKKEGLKLLEDLKSSCLVADYNYSTVTDIDDHEISIPAIMLKEELCGKDDLVGKTVTTAWRSMSVNAFESYLFLHLQFEGTKEIIFNIILNDPGMSKWVRKVIETGAIIICDKSGEFDIGITDIPIDIPVMQLYLNQLRTSQSGVAGRHDERLR